MKKRDTTAVEAQIDENLKKAFEAVLNEKVPDRLTRLLEQLKAQEGSERAATPKNSPEDQA
jgi:hypothetical protein